MNDMYTPTLTMCMVFSFLAISRTVTGYSKNRLRDTAKKENTIQIVKVGVCIFYFNVLLVKNIWTKQITKFNDIIPLKSTRN